MSDPLDTSSILLSDYVAMQRDLDRVTKERDSALRREAVLRDTTAELRALRMEHNALLALRVDWETVAQEIYTSFGISVSELTRGHPKTNKEK